jgi:DNA-binding FadR family transcriptional regulator
MASRNKMLRQVLSSYQVYIKYSRNRKSYDEHYLEVVLEEHRKIYQAFLAGDEEGAVRAMEEHMENSRRRQSREY